MARVTEAEVKEVINTTLEEYQITVFVNTANTLVNAHLSSSGLGASLLAEIEKYVAAHLIASTRDQKPTEVEIDGVREKYQGVTGTDLKATFYGQIAIALDSTGKLGMVGKRKSSMTAIDLDLA